MRIPWLLPQIGKKEQKFINEVLKSRYLNDGKYARIFEEKICKLIGCKYALVVSSGTAAIFLSLKALGVGQGDEVIVPDLTFIATANAADLCGAKPVLVDINPLDLTIDPAAFKNAITKRTKAVVPVHVSGRASNMEDILKIAKENNISVVEDAAEAFMSKYKNKFLGTFGQTGCFSWSAAKIITAGQGGAVVTNDKNLYLKLKILKDQGRVKQGTGGDDIHSGMGYNFKWTDLQAAVGLGQLSNIQERVNRKKRQYLLYKKSLQDLENLSIFNFDVEDGELPLWTDGIFKNSEDLNNFLKKKDIECRKFWFPLHTQRPYKLPDNSFPNSTKLSSELLWLPSGMDLKDNQAKIVCEQIKKFYT